MRITHGFTPLGTPHAVTIGNFDGLHLGHQAMLARLQDVARARGLPSCVLSFEPHPREFFTPEQAPARLSSLREKAECLQRMGIDRLHVFRFDRAFSALTAEAFIEQVLGTTLEARYVLVGDDFRYGAKRAGDFALLKQAGQSLGFDAEFLPTVEVAGERASSTAVRQALAAGELEHAERLLGRPYSISGHVVHGRKLGRELGFRTLNLRFSHWKPAASGIFAVKVFGLGPDPLPGVANLGIRPSLDPNDVNGGRVLLETHCLDWP
ncbi:MAG: bifunctional riboflavin kinase/FAD synthetase, partial [Thiobacillus sp.]|nr:bifunctional riboflavin kinase/FAD synthetase [Thiobacillus sp.]